MLEPFGGLLFEGFKRDASAEERSKEVISDE
jgi:hypothetical protein